MGFIQWRSAFYVAGNPDVAVENFFMLLDDFFSFKSKALAKDIEINVRPHKSAAAEVTSDLVESLSYEHLTFHPASNNKLPLKMFEAQPVVHPIILNELVLTSKDANSNSNMFLLLRGRETRGHHVHPAGIGNERLGPLGR